MTWTEIANKLATIDPALTEQQRCVHEWKACLPGVVGIECHKCTQAHCQGGIEYDSQLAAEMLEVAPLVGDGRNEERYGTVDALIRLCDDLELHMTLHGCKSTGYGAVATTPSEDFFGDNNDPRIALATAILKAMGVAVE